MIFTIHTRVSAELEAEWDALAEQVGTHFGARPTYALSWHRCTGKGRLAVATVHRKVGGRKLLVALLGMHTRIRGGLPVKRLLGHGLGTVGEALAVDDAALDALVDGLRRRGAILQLTHLETDSPLVAALRRSGRWKVEVALDDHCPVVDLPKGVTSRSLRSGSTLRRSASTRRKLERAGTPMTIEKVTTAEQLEHFWPDIVRTAAASADAERASGAEPRQDLCATPWGEFTYAFLHQEATRGRLLVWGALFGGVWGAHMVTLRSGSRAELWLTRYSPLAASSRPGHQLIESICDTHDEVGITEFDFLIGRNPYKTDWQTREYSVATVVAAPRTIGVALYWLRGADAVFSALRGLRARFSGTRHPHTFPSTSASHPTPS